MFLRFLRTPDVNWKEDIIVGKDYVIYGEGYECYIIDEAGDSNYEALDFPDDSIHTNKEKRPHYDLRIAHANGADIEFSDDEGVTWEACEHPRWEETCLYRIAIPKPPERVFPVTSLTDDEMVSIVLQTSNTFTVEDYRDIANAAIRRYIEDSENE